MLAVARMSGLTDESSVILQFRLFGFREHDLSKLRGILENSYTVSPMHCEAIGVYLLDCTTEPNYVVMREESITDWFYQIYDLATSNDCGFTRWSIIDPHTGQSVSTSTFL